MPPARAGVLHGVATASLAVALSRPHVAYQAQVEQASIMLVTDHSGSMSASDVQPTRLYAAVKAANTFIDQLPSRARVGAVAFSSAPDAVQGPVTDHHAARSVIDSQQANGAKQEHAVGSKQTPEHPRVPHGGTGQGSGVWCLVLGSSKHVVLPRMMVQDSGNSVNRSAANSNLSPLVSLVINEQRLME